MQASTTAIFAIAGILIASSTVHSVPVDDDSNLARIIKSCKGVTGQSEIAACVVRAFDTIKVLGTEPMPLLNLDSFDPGVADGDVHIKAQNPDMKMEMNFTDVFFKGASDIVVKNISIDYDKKILYGASDYPTLRLQGNYKMKADLRELLLNGEGTFWFDISGFKITDSYIEFEMREFDGVPRLQILKPHVTNAVIPIETMKFRFNNLVNGDDVLDNAANAVLYENRQQLTGLVYDDVVDAACKFMQKTSNVALRTIDIDDMAGANELKRTFKLN